MEVPAVRTELYEQGVVIGLIDCEVLQEFAGGELPMICITVSCWPVALLSKEL